MTWSTDTFNKCLGIFVTDVPNDCMTHPEEFVKSLTPIDLLVDEFKVKDVAIIILHLNLIPTTKLYNETRLSTFITSYERS